MNNIWKITRELTTEHRQTAYKVKTVLKTMEKSLENGQRKMEKTAHKITLFKAIEK